MDVVDLYHWRMRQIEKALDAHKDESITAISALGRIRTVVNMSNAQARDGYIAERRQSEPNWEPPEGNS